MSVDNFPFFCGKLSLGVDLSFPRIPGIQLFSVNKYEQNREHRFQAKTYMQLVGLFPVVFFLSACLHAEDPLEVEAGGATNYACYMEDCLLDQEYMHLANT